jgi:hypothetical protein
MQWMGSCRISLLQWQVVGGCTSLDTCICALQMDRLLWGDATCKHLQLAHRTLIPLQALRHHAWVPAMGCCIALGGWQSMRQGAKKKVQARGERTAAVAACVRGL